MSQLKIQIIFVAIFVLFAFDDVPGKPGPVRIKRLPFFNLIIIYLNLTINYRSCRGELRRHKILDTLHAQLLS